MDLSGFLFGQSGVTLHQQNRAKKPVTETTEWLQGCLRPWRQVRLDGLATLSMRRAGSLWQASLCTFTRPCTFYKVISIISCSAYTTVQRKKNCFQSFSSPSSFSFPLPHLLFSFCSALHFKGEQSHYREGGWGACPPLKTARPLCEAWAMTNDAALVRYNAMRLCPRSMDSRVAAQACRFYKCPWHEMDMSSVLSVFLWWIDPWQHLLLHFLSVLHVSPSLEMGALQGEAWNGMW